MDNPKTKGNCTKEKLQDYADYRKARTIYDIEQIFRDEKVKNGEISPEEHEEYRDPLAFTKETVVTVELSTGGDADGFKLTFDQNQELIRSIYYWADWGVYEEVELSQEELDLVEALYCVTDWLRGC